MYGGYAYGNEPYAGSFTSPNSQETITDSPGSPYNFTTGVAIAPITITCDDPDGGATTLSLVSGSLPAGLSLSHALPRTAAVPFNTTITGTPTLAGVSTLVFRNDDGIGLVSEITISITVTDAVVVVRGDQPLSRNFRLGRYMDSRIQ